MGNRAVLASFLGVLAVITYRDFKHPDSSWPLGPVPPPYRYVWAAVVFGILAIVSDAFNETVASVVAVGVLFGAVYQVITVPGGGAEGTSLAPGYDSSTTGSGVTGSAPVGQNNGGVIQA